MKLETPMAMITAKVFMATGKNGLTAKTIKTDRVKPTSPPRTDRTTDSVKN